MTKQEAIIAKMEEIVTYYKDCASVKFELDREALLELESELSRLKEDKEDEEEPSEIREAVANYMYSEGCSCCQDVDAHAEHKKRLAELLNVPAWDDDSGYNFSQFKTNQ